MTAKIFDFKAEKERRLDDSRRVLESQQRTWAAAEFDAWQRYWVDRMTLSWFQVDEDNRSE